MKYQQSLEKFNEIAECGCLTEILIAGEFEPMFNVLLSSSVKACLEDGGIEDLFENAVERYLESDYLSHYEAVEETIRIFDSEMEDILEKLTNEKEIDEEDYEFFDLVTEVLQRHGY